MSATAQVISLLKKCTSCGEEKSISDFHRRTASRDGRHSLCKPCNFRISTARYKASPKLRAAAKKRFLRRQAKGRAWNRIQDFRKRIKSQFDITLEEAVGMLAKQYGLCANRACGITLSFDVHGHDVNRAILDHCHTTGKLRGVLCRQCNLTLGLFEKNRNRAIGLSEYLAKF